MHMQFDFVKYCYYYYYLFDFIFYSLIFVFIFAFCIYNFWFLNNFLSIYKKMFFLSRDRHFTPHFIWFMSSQIENTKCVSPRELNGEFFFFAFSDCIIGSNERDKGHAIWHRIYWLNEHGYQRSVPQALFLYIVRNIAESGIIF